MTLSQLRIYGPVTTAERDAMVSGGSTVPLYTVVFNSDNVRFEFWDGGAWEGVLGREVRVDGGLIVTDSLIVGGVIDVSGAIAADSAVHSPLAAGDRLKLTQGTPFVAAANDLTLIEGNTFEITGATTINTIDTTDWTPGTYITLLFASTPTVKHGQATSGVNYTILLAGAVDFVASAGDTLTLLFCDLGGVLAWREIGRAVI